MMHVRCSFASVILTLGCVVAATSAKVTVVTPPENESAIPASSPADAASPTVADVSAQLKNDPRYGLLTPLPSRGGVPAIVDKLDQATPAELAGRAKAREYQQQIRVIRNKHLGDRRVPAQREEGIRQLREFTDPAAFLILFTELQREKDDVRTAVLDHIAAQGEMGQATLAWIATFEAGKATDPRTATAMREVALSRMTQPTSPPVNWVIDRGLRSGRHQVVNNAAMVAGALKVVQAIPLLMMAQVAADPVRTEGDLAWIAIETQQLFVERMDAVVGDGVVAFVPVLGVQNSGTLLRVVDAVAVSYRIDVHRALVGLTTEEWGRSTEHLGYDPRQWWVWYNDEFVPHMRRKLHIADVVEGGDTLPPT